MKANSFFRLSRSIVIICVLGLALIGCGGAPAAPAQVGISTTEQEQNLYWPTSGWRTATPEQQGMDSRLLDQMLAAVKRQNLNLHSLLVIRHGYLVSETYFGNYGPETQHELYSCTKSFVSTLIGIALDQGYIERLDQPVIGFFPERTFQNVDARKADMSLEDVLTMRTGLDWQEGDPEIQALYRSPDWLANVLGRPMIADPGREFNYCSGCSHILAAVLQKTNGDLLAFARTSLFDPLGIGSVRWETGSNSIPIGGWGLQLTPRDMAKLGYLFLHEGQWDGQQIVSESWVKAAVQSHTATGGDLGYGFQWWTYPLYKAYTALGLYGQTIFVIPEDDLVVVTTAQASDHTPIFNLIEQYIVPSIL